MAINWLIELIFRQRNQQFSEELQDIRRDISILASEMRENLERADWSLLKSLNETIQHLNAVVEGSNASNSDQDCLAQAQAEIRDLERERDLARAKVTTLEHERDVAISKITEMEAQSTKSNPGSPSSPSGKPSAIAEQAMALRDWLMTSSLNTTLTTDVLTAEADRAIKKMLDQEGIFTIDKTGPFDEMTQEICGTAATNDPAADETVASTYLPGYRFHGRLLRTQKVIVFGYQR